MKIVLLQKIETKTKEEKDESEEESEEGDKPTPTVNSTANLHQTSNFKPLKNFGGK